MEFLQLTSSTSSCTFVFPYRQEVLLRRHEVLDPDGTRRPRRSRGNKDLQGCFQSRQQPTEENRDGGLRVSSCTCSSWGECSHSHYGFDDGSNRQDLVVADSTRAARHYCRLRTQRVYDTPYMWGGEQESRMWLCKFPLLHLLEVISPTGASNGQILFLIPISKSSWLDLTVWIFQLMLT